MTLQQLKYVVEIAKCGSINKAARHLFVSQSSLSNAVKELELEMNIHIFFRSNTGIVLSTDGVEFIKYAKQILEQAELLENRYLGAERSFQQFSVSAQHYAFVVDAFAQLLKENPIEEYEFNLRETRTFQVIEDVKNMYSDIGILYRSPMNQNIMDKLFKENNLIFTPLFTASPHVFISAKHPLAHQDFVTLEELGAYPCLSFEQGEHSSFHFLEEFLVIKNHRKNIYVTDRATLFNLLIGVNGYTISTGFLNTDLTGGKGIIAVPIDSDDIIEVGWIANNNFKLSKLAVQYLDILKSIIMNSSLRSLFHSN